MADSPKYRGERTGQPAQTQQGGDEPGSEPVTLNWAIWDKESTAYWTALADEYMKTHENVKIEMTSSLHYSAPFPLKLAGRERTLL